MLNFHLTRYPDLLQKYRDSRRLRDIFPTVTAIKDKVVFTEMEVGEVAQAYQAKWTPKGDLNLVPEEYQVRYMKVDKTIDPNSLRQTYMADALPGAKSVEHEVVRKFYGSIMERAARDTDNALVNGKYVAPTEGTAGSSLQMVDGLKEVIRGFVAKKQITPFTMSAAMDDTNACLIVRELWEQIPAEFRYNVDLKCYMFDSTWDKYTQSYDANYGTIRDFSENKRHFVRNTDCEIVRIPYGGASDMVVFTMDKNIRLVDNDPNDAFHFEVEKEKRMINYMMDWAAGIAIVVVGEAGNAENQYVWCNNFDYIKSSIPASGGGSASGSGGQGSEDSETGSQESEEGGDDTQQ